MINIFSSATIVSAVNVTDVAALFDADNGTATGLCAGGNASEIVLDLGGYYTFANGSITAGAMGGSNAALNALATAGDLGDGGATVLFGLAAALSGSAATLFGSDTAGTIRSVGMNDQALKARHLKLTFTSAAAFTVRGLDVQGDRVPAPPRILLAGDGDKLDWDGVYPAGATAVQLMFLKNGVLTVAAIGDSDPDLGHVLPQNAPQIYGPLPDSAGTDEVGYTSHIRNWALRAKIGANWFIGPVTHPIQPPAPVQVESGWRELRYRVPDLPVGFVYDLMKSVDVFGAGRMVETLAANAVSGQIVETGPLQPGPYGFWLRKYYDQSNLSGYISGPVDGPTVDGRPLKPNPPDVVLIENSSGANFTLPALPTGGDSLQLRLNGSYFDSGNTFDFYYPATPHETTSLHNLGPGVYFATTVAFNVFRVTTDEYDSTGRTDSDAVFFTIPERAPVVPGGGDYGCVPGVPPAPLACIQNLNAVRVRGVSALQWPPCTNYLSFETSADNGATWQVRKTNIARDAPFTANFPVCAGMRVRFVAHK